MPQKRLPVFFIDSRGIMIIIKTQLADIAVFNVLVFLNRSLDRAYGLQSAWARRAMMNCLTREVRPCQGL